VEVFSIKLIIFSFTLTDLDLRAKVILLTRDLTPFPSPGLLRDSPCGAEKERKSRRNLQWTANCVCDVSLEKLALLSFTFLATYISRAEAAVRSRCADNPVDIWWVEALHIHVHQVLLEGWKNTFQWIFIPPKIAAVHLWPRTRYLCISECFGKTFSLPVWYFSPSFLKRILLTTSL